MELFQTYAILYVLSIFVMTCLACWVDMSVDSKINYFENLFNTTKAAIVVGAVHALLIVIS